MAWCILCSEITLSKLLHLPGTNGSTYCANAWIQFILKAYICPFNTLRPRQNGRHFADDTFKRIFVYVNVKILIEISLKFVPKGPINNIPALVQIMAWRRPGDKPLSEPMLVCLLTHICVTRPQWVNLHSSIVVYKFDGNFIFLSLKSSEIDHYKVLHMTWQPCW